MREGALSRREPAWVSADNACVSMLLCLYDPENELDDDILMLTSIANLIQPSLCLTTLSTIHLLWPNA